MENTTVSKSQQTTQLPQRIKSDEFDPCSNAKPCSPFYLYNHDSPRASIDHKPKPSVTLSVQDLETGSTMLTPSTTQEKLDNNGQHAGRLASWRGRLVSRRCQQMTRPKQKGWIARMPKKQRIMVKSFIAFLVIGCMVGIAVGIAAGLKSGVWKSNSQQGDIHRI